MSVSFTPCPQCTAGGVTDHVGFLREKMTCSLCRHRFWKAKLRFRTVFCSLKQKAGTFKFLWIEESFRKAQFSWWISVDDRPNTELNLRFQGLWILCTQSKFIQITQLAREVNVQLSQNTRLKVKGYIFFVLIKITPLHRPHYVGEIWKCSFS